MGDVLGLREDEVSAAPGVYTLIIRLRREEKIRVGRLGSKFFPEGYYSYTGSAVGRGAFNLDGRVKHHLKPKKFMRWHIDYLLGSKNAEIDAVVFSETDVNRECEVSQSIGSLGGTEVIMKGFGSSDCKMGCKSHLYYFREKALPRIVKNVFETYEKRGLKPCVLMLEDAS